MVPGSRCCGVLTFPAALLQAIADKLIPGIGKALRIVLVSQVTDSLRASDEAAALSSLSLNDLSVLQHVVRGDVKRAQAMKEFEGAFISLVLAIQGTILKQLSSTALTRAVDSPKLAETQRIFSELRLERLQTELFEARKVASRTSGARGKKAREEELKAEARVRDAEEA